jgi:hypothetical protein
MGEVLGISGMIGLVLPKVALRLTGETLTIIKGNAKTLRRGQLILGIQHKKRPLLVALKRVGNRGVGVQTWALRREVCHHLLLTTLSSPLARRALPAAQLLLRV